MKVLITGAAGFIGSHLADALISQGHDVVGIDNLSTGAMRNVNDAMFFIPGDIRDEVPSDDWDLVFHCAASYKDRDDWERDASTNVLGTIKVVREALRAKAKLIYFQTSLCYGKAPRSPIKIDAALNPEGSYAVSKTAGENYIRDSGLAWTSLRLANIYGPRNLSGPPPTFFKRLSEGKPCTVVDSRRDFVYIDDLVAVALQAADWGRGPFHVASGADFSILDVYLAVAAAMGIDAPMPEITPRAFDDAASLLLDPTATFVNFGWKASTPLAEGMERAVAWYREHGVAETFTHLVMKG